MKAPLPKGPSHIKFAFDRIARGRTFKAILYRRAIDLGGRWQSVGAHLAYNPFMPKAVLRARVSQSVSGTRIRAAVGLNNGARLIFAAAFAFLGLILALALFSAGGNFREIKGVIVADALMIAIYFGFFGMFKAIIGPDEELLQAFARDCLASLD